MPMRNELDDDKWTVHPITCQVFCFKSAAPLTWFPNVFPDGSVKTNHLASVTVSVDLLHYQLSVSLLQFI